MYTAPLSLSHHQQQAKAPDDKRQAKGGQRRRTVVLFSRHGISDGFYKGVDEPDRNDRSKQQKRVHKEYSQDIQLHPLLSYANIGSFLPPAYILYLHPAILLILIPPVKLKLIESEPGVTEIDGAPIVTWL